MLVNGEKWACISCIKGHRVSGCNHADRELHHINPKGRPVKQCEHCRGARKSKSHHAKCECGSKKDKDKHKDKGAAKVGSKGCCCHSGGKCICGTKKDNIELKLDTSKKALHATRTKPTLKTAQSDTTLTVFANGHHKPCHRNNFAAHVSGAPYRIHRPHTLHGSAAFANYTQSQPISKPDGIETSQRAVDTLAVSNNDYYAMFGSAQRGADSVPITPLTASIDPSAFQDSLFAAQNSSFAPDNNSPRDHQPAEPLWPWATATASVNQNFGYGSLSTSPSQDYSYPESEWAIASAGLNNPIWSAGDLPLDPSKLNDSLAQPISHSGESNKQSLGGLTTASSSQSEAGEPAVFGDLEYKKAPSATSDILFWEDTPVFCYPPAQSSASMAPVSTSYVEAAPLDKNMLPTIPSTSSTDKGALFPTTDFNDLCAIAMPNTGHDALADSWVAMNQNNVYDGPDFFNMPSGFQQPW